MGPWEVIFENTEFSFDPKTGKVCKVRRINEYSEEENNRTKALIAKLDSLMDFSEEENNRTKALIAKLDSLMDRSEEVEEETQNDDSNLNEALEYAESKHLENNRKDNDSSKKPFDSLSSVLPQQKQSSCALQAESLPDDRNSEFQTVFTDMDESTGIATSSPSEAASGNPMSPDSLTYQVEICPNTPEHVEEVTPERISLPVLKYLLRHQLEYYFSRENLSTDEYLQSQMDADNYVAIATVAKFNQVRRLTDDHNLVVEVLRESAVVQVDEAGEKVRPKPRPGVLILREIPESTPLKELEELFSGENCPKFLRCEFAHNSCWYVLFESDDDTQKAYQHLREENKTFRGKPVMARIKAITSAPFTTYKNGVGNTREQESYSGQNINQPQQAPLQYAYTNVPNDGYNQQVCPPFYPPTMLQAWAPTTPACVDLGTVLSVNGLSPQAAFSPLNNNTNRHNYTSRERPVKTYTPQNFNFSHSEQNRYFNRGQSTSYIQRQQLHQQAASFPNIVNTSNCTFDYVPYSASRSRNLHNFGMDMNFFTAPNLYYSKLPSLYPAHASQARHNPVLVPRSPVGLSALNCQDQSYIAVGGSNALNYSKDSGANATGGGKQGADSQVKENWAPNQRQQRSKRWWKENGSTGSSRNDTDIVDVDVYESHLSDIVKGTRPATRDTETQTSESALICSTKDSSTITIEDAVIPTDGAFTPPASPEIVAETGSTSEPISVENCQDLGDWEDFVESVDGTLCSTSINPINVVPDVSVTFGASNSPAFHPLSTNSMVNGSVVTAESSPSVPATLPEAEPIANVPSEIINERQTAVKLPKTKQLDSLPKGNRSPCDLPSPKNKILDTSTIKNKFDNFKDRPSVVSKHRTSFSNSKNSESSSSNKERVYDFMPANSKTLDHSASKGSDAFHIKEKSVQGHKNKVLDSNSNKNRSSEAETTLLSVNGHADSESTVSSEDEKPFRKLTYSEVAMRAKEKVEKIAQELKEKERQEAMVRQHRQQDNVAQSRQASTRGPFKEFPRGRIMEPRPGSKEWRERRKTARAISLPAAGQ